MGREQARYRRGRSGRPLERAKARVYATETHCCRCGRPVDMALPYRNPTTGRVNLWSKSFDHLTELDAGGDPLDGHLAHVKCNAEFGARYANAKHARGTERAPEALRSSADLDDEAPPLRPRRE